jgi:UPF0755 protein
MTEYGRGHGSEPWYPDDPLFGDPYQPQQHQYQQQSYGHDQGHDQDQGGWDPYGGGQQQPQYPYDDQRRYHPQQPQPQPQYDAWGNPVPYGDQYGDQYGDPYGGSGQPDYYTQQDPSRAQPPREEPPQEPLRADPEPPADWDPDPAPGEADDHPFFSDAPSTASDDEDDDSLEGRGARRRNGRTTAGKGKAAKGGKGGKKRRSGCACLVVVLVLGGGIGAAGWFGYRFYQSHFGPAPDFSGQGSGEVQVEIPDGSTLTSMGNILKKAGVVKSVDAFTTAAGKNPKGSTIQGGVYILHKQMSAAAAVTMMLNPKAQSVLIIAEGMRDTQIYQAVDAKLGLTAGTTKKVAATQIKKLGLPGWADDNAEIKDPLEGFLFPSRYPVAKNTKPVDLLRQMVARATAEYSQYDLAGQAKKFGLKSPLQIVTVASLVQAEAQQNDEFGKVSRVIYNRLDQNMFLGFDSTINYALGRSTLSTTTADTKLQSSYNTYINKGLPPGPIGNPGHQAMQAATSPTEGPWLYFVTVKPGDTRFTDNFAVHQKNVQEFNQYQRKNGG